MKRVLVLIATVAALAAASTSANAAPKDGCPNCVPLGNVLSPFFFGRGVAGYVAQPNWWVGPRLPGPSGSSSGGTSQAVVTSLLVPPGTPVYGGGLPGVAAAAQAAEVAQARFMTLYQRFPHAPTRRQWKVLYRPLIRQAIAVDTSILSTISTYVTARTAYDKAELDACAAQAGGDRLDCTFPTNPLYDVGVDPKQVSADKAILVPLLSIAYPTAG